jgi:hypothetical protein
MTNSMMMEHECVAVQQSESTFSACAHPSRSGVAESSDCDANASREVLHADDVGTGGLGSQDEELRVPDQIESIKVSTAHGSACWCRQAREVKIVQEHQTVFVRSGEHRWQGEIQVKANRTLHVTAELGARLLLSLPTWVGVRV